MEKNNLLPIEKGLASKIYGLAFQDPQSSYNLAKQIGTQPHHVNAKIKELYKQKYLLKIENKEWRWPRWRANPDALIKKIEHIKQKEHITLTELDKQVLSERFDNYLFRMLNCQSFQGEVEKNTNANAVDDILCGFEMFMRIMEQSSEYVEACNKITTKADYQKMRREQKKSIKHLWLQYKLNIFVNTIKDEDIPALQNYIEINFGKKITLGKLQQRIKDLRASKELKIFDQNMLEKVQKQLGDSPDIEHFLLTSFVTPIPKHLLEHYKGISSWGRKYSELEGMIQIVMEFKFIDILRRLDEKEK